MIDWEGYREPGKPDLLMQYEAVKDYPLEPNPVPTGEVCLIGIRKLYHEKNNVFTDKLHQLTMSHQEWRLAQERARILEAEAKLKEAEPRTNVPSDWDGKGACPTCKREEKRADASTLECLAKAEKWLEENDGG